MAAVSSDHASHDESLLSAYLDGELSGTELSIVAHQLDHCLDCVAEFRDVQRTRRAVRLLPRLELPDDLVVTHLGELLSSFLDGELTEDERRYVTEHISYCGSCRTELAGLDAARSAVRSMPVIGAPDVLVGTQRPADGRRRPVVWVASVAAVAALLVGVMWSRPTPERIDLDTIANMHTARVSVDSGFGAVPAVAPGAPMVEGP